MQFAYHSRRLLFFNQNAPSRDSHCPEVVRITDKEIRLLARRALHCSGLEVRGKWRPHQARSVGTAAIRAATQVAPTCIRGPAASVCVSLPGTIDL